MAKPCILFYQVIPMLLLCTEPGSSDSRKDRTIKADYGGFEGSNICGLSSHLEQRHVPELEETPFCKPSSTTALQAVPIRAKPDRTHASGFGTRRQDTMAKPCILFYQPPWHGCCHLEIT
uniref:Putative secreted protein n=1 Tax=Ixodes ricinus TaxID=34613 RepID=A0A147BPF1_IXORI